MSYPINVTTNTINTTNYVTTSLDKGVYNVTADIATFSNSGRVYGGGGVEQPVSESSCPRKAHSDVDRSILNGTDLTGSPRDLHAFSGIGLPAVRRRHPNGES